MDTTLTITCRVEDPENKTVVNPTPKRGVQERPVRTFVKRALAVDTETNRVVYRVSNRKRKSVESALWMLRHRGIVQSVTV